MTFLDDVIKLAKDHDATRPRSQQVSVGWSEVGGCRAYLGYRLDGAWASDETDTWAAQRGTAIHAYLETVITGPGIRTEIDTEYRGIPGHADIVTADALWDFKTTSLASSRMWAADHSLLRQKRVQIHGYAAGLVDAGELPPDATVGLLVVPVDGTFRDWWSYEEPFDRALADEGADRLQQVRDLMAAGEPLPKDKPMTWCSNWCLAGETEVVTSQGIRPIRELAGKSHALLVPSRGSVGVNAGGGHGHWETCEVRSFGVQPLMALTVRRGRTVKTVYATADHQWVTKQGHVTRTADLISGTRLRAIRRNATTNLAEVPFAVAQGFVYGDGALPSDQGSAASVNLYANSPKPKSMLGYFTAHNIQPITDPRTGETGWHVPMIPRSWKAAPDLGETRSFLLSWLAGYIAADGNVSPAGQTTISSSRKTSLELVRSVCAIVGVGYSPIQTRQRIGRRQTEPSDLFQITVRTRDLPDWAFKNEHHQRYAATLRRRDHPGFDWIVESVTTTDRTEEVFCAIVPDVEAFALADELLTHNCPFVSMCRGADDPQAAEEITDAELVAAVARYGETAQQITRLYKDKDGLAEMIRGLRGTAGEWRIGLSKAGEPKDVPDEAAIAADYAARGEVLPMTTKPGNAPRLNVRRIKKAA